MCINTAVRSMPDSPSTMQWCILVTQAKRPSSSPSMMYTSQSDSVYANEARVLGAVDTLPKQLKPEELQQVFELPDREAIVVGIELFIVQVLTVQPVAARYVQAKPVCSGFSGGT